MITQVDSDSQIAKYADLETRGSFYPMAMGLMERGLQIEACILMLATWNFARFRYAVNTFDLAGFEQTVRSLEPRLRVLRHLSLKTAEFDEHLAEIYSVFRDLSSIKGIEFTGASKLLHLINPDLFVMWDAYIRTAYGLNRKGYDPYEDYLEFLKRMQAEFKHLAVPGRRRLTKCIDEYNYCKYTIPALRAHKESQTSRAKRTDGQRPQGEAT